MNLGSQSQRGECEICSEIYSEETFKMPNCGHTFCFTCAQKYFRVQVCTYNTQKLKND